MSPARRAACAAFALLLASPARAVAPRTPLGADTPQALVERMVKAADKKDVAEIFACLDPESRTEATTGLLMGTTDDAGVHGPGLRYGHGHGRGRNRGAL